MIKRIEYPTDEEEDVDNIPTSPIGSDGKH